MLNFYQVSKQEVFANRPANPLFPDTLLKQLWARCFLHRPDETPNCADRAAVAALAVVPANPYASDADKLTPVLGFLVNYARQNHPKFVRRQTITAMPVQNSNEQTVSDTLAEAYRAAFYLLEQAVWLLQTRHVPVFGDNDEVVNALNFPHNNVLNSIPTAALLSENPVRLVLTANIRWTDTPNGRMAQTESRLEAQESLVWNYEELKYRDIPFCRNVLQVQNRIRCRLDMPEKTVSLSHPKGAFACILSALAAVRLGKETVLRFPQIMAETAETAMCLGACVCDVVYMEKMFRTEQGQQYRKELDNIRHCDAGACNWTFSFQYIPDILPETLLNQLPDRFPEQALCGKNLPLPKMLCGDDFVPSDTPPEIPVLLSPPEKSIFDALYVNKIK